MNIFVLDLDHKKCAEYHNDKHVVKMILESVQILSTVNRLTGLDEGYRKTHMKHPCTLWTMESLDNWMWLKELTISLHNEWIYRYDKTVTHKSIDRMYELSTPNLPKKGLTPFVLAMPDKYKCDDPVESYRKYYMGDKRHIATWKKRPTPDWFE